MADMLLRNTSTGAFQASYVSGNTIVGATQLGTVGTEWNFAGIGNFHGTSSLSDLMLRNSSSGAFELYQVVAAACCRAIRWGQSATVFRSKASASSPRAARPRC
jgi:hypothetical protein